MAERERTGVVWREDTHQIEVSYRDGASDQLIGSETVAAVLAADAGLDHVKAGDGIWSWVKPPG